MDRWSIYLVYSSPVVPVARLSDRVISRQDLPDGITVVNADVAPVTKSDARDDKKTAVPEHSSGLPQRPAGVPGVPSGHIFTQRHKA